MYGQMTAGSWIYIGSQGIVQGTYETFVEAGRQHYQGSLKGRWVLTAGLGGMGGAQPLAATLAGACSLNIECQQSRIDFRLRTRYVDEQATSLDDALARIKKYTAEGRAISIALCGNAADIVPEMVKRGVRPDMVTDQTSAPRSAAWLSAERLDLGRVSGEAESDPQGTILAAKRSMADHVQAMLAFNEMGVPTFDYGNNIRQMAQEMGVDNAFDFPGFVPAYIRPLFCRGIGPFRWVALSGDPQDIYKTDAKVKEIIKDDQHLHHWLDMAELTDLITMLPDDPGAHCHHAATFVGDPDRRAPGGYRGHAGVRLSLLRHCLPAGLGLLPVPESHRHPGGPVRPASGHRVPHRLGGTLSGHNRLLGNGGLCARPSRSCGGRTLCGSLRRAAPLEV